MLGNAKLQPEEKHHPIKWHWMDEVADGGKTFSLKSVGSNTLLKSESAEKMVPSRAILATLCTNIFVLLSVNDFLFHRGTQNSTNMAPIIFTLTHSLHCADRSALKPKDLWTSDSVFSEFLATFKPLSMCLISKQVSFTARAFSTT